MRRWSASGRTCWRRTSTSTRRCAACAIPLEPPPPIAEALLDQRALAGIGNVYKSEVLWIERVSPFTPVAAVSDEALRRLVDTARRLLTVNATATRGPERVTTAGDRGAPGPLYVYGRTGRPCRRCRTPIARATQGRDLPRSTFWCPACQPNPD